MSRNAYDYWSSLESLCRIIDKGDKALNVPTYNGGLFETIPEGFLSENKMSDPYLAEAIQLLTLEKASSHDGPSFIDYSSLGVRHLGDIYEGLLEFHVRIADEDIVEVKEKNKFFWKRSAEVKEAKSNRIKKKGEVYIENSKHERKATGSYYTPHYIVDYIVKNTIGPVLDERFKKAEEMLAELEAFYKKQRKQFKKSGDWKHWEHPGEPIGKHINEILNKEKEVFETVFNIKVLDPSMGSGHFLVHAVDYISDRIITFLAKYPENPVIRRIEEIRTEILKDVAKQGVRIDEDRLTEVNLIKRTVMKRCIYGVDLNEMAVELAKLSLWLDSFTLGAPLSFLDHHLKWGNSLIGTDLEELYSIAYGKYDEGRVGDIFTFNLEPLRRAIRNMLFVSDISDATYHQVKESADKYKEADNNLSGYRILLDTILAQYYGIKEVKTFLRLRGIGIDLNNLKKSLSSLAAKDKKIIEAIETIAKEKRFFHWEIEFPEVFFERTGESEQKIEKKKNPGFDCVIGNPPYGMAIEKDVIKQFYPASSQNLDFYSAFMEHGFPLLKSTGYFSFIVPVSWQTGVSYEALRRDLLGKYIIGKLINLPYDVFKDAYIDTGIFVFTKSGLSNRKDHVSVFEFPKQTKVDNLDRIDYASIDQNVWKETNQIILNAEAISLLAKLFKGYVIPLGEITISARGVLAKPEQVSYGKKKEWQTFFDGELFRYETDSPHKFISYSNDLPEYPSSFDFFVGARVLVRRLVSRQDRIMACFASETYVNKKDIYIFKSKDTTSPLYLLALLNSSLLSYVYLSQDVVAKKDDFRQTTLDGLRKLPIPSISFNTPEKKRKKKVAEGIALYEDYMLEFGGSLKGTAKYNTSVMDEREKEDGSSVGYPGTGEGLYGLRGGEGEQEDAGSVAEKTAQYALPLNLKKTGDK